MRMLLPEHSHCLYCGNPISEGLEYCDENCKKAHEEEKKAEKKADIKFYGIVAASLIAIFAVGMIIKFL